MDIEGPDSPIRSIRDFAIHIATVTIGILIALGLEALVEAHRNQELVEHTRADFRAEFTTNRAAVLADLKRMEAVKTELQGLIAYAQARIAGRAATLPVLQSTRSFAFVTTTAWETAVATQALIHMPFKEAGQISAAQSKQAALNALQSRAEDEWFDLAAYGDPRAIPKEEYHPALEKVTIAYAYLVSVRATERELVGVYDEALKGIGR
jgi:hypothetical protein